MRNQLFIFYKIKTNSKPRNPVKKFSARRKFTLEDFVCTICNTNSTHGNIIGQKSEAAIDNELELELEKRKNLNSIAQKLRKGKKALRL